MRYKLLIFSLSILSFCRTSNAQNQNSDSIFKQEIPEIIISSKSNNKLNVLDLTKYKSSLSAFLDCNDNVGIFVPHQINSSNLYISSIEIPIKDKTNGDSWGFNFFVIISYNGKDSLINLSMLKKEVKKGKLIYTFSENIPLPGHSNGFYLFTTYVCPQKQYHGNMLLGYTEKFKSALTYSYQNQKIILKDMKKSYQVPPGEFFDKYKFLNWKVKINYAVNN